MWKRGISFLLVETPRIDSSNNLIENYYSLDKRQNPMTDKNHQSLSANAQSILLDI